MSLSRLSPVARSLAKPTKTFTFFSSFCFAHPVPFASFTTITTSSRFTSRSTSLLSSSSSSSSLSFSASSSLVVPRFAPSLLSVLPSSAAASSSSSSSSSSSLTRSGASSTRSFSSSPSSNSTNQILEGSKAAISKLQTASTEQLFHYSSFALAGLTPVALILSPSILNVPVDLVLGIVIPYHAHIGMNGVLEDYIPRPQQGLAKGALLFITVLTTIGLLKINLCGAGITESFKSLWREPKKEQKKIKQ